MMGDGSPNGKLSLQQRIAPGRVAELEQRAAQQTALLVTRAAHELTDLANTLQYLVDQAGIGNEGARAVLRLWFATEAKARAAAAGVVLPGGS
jgi:hypothetical protein